VTEAIRNVSAPGLHGPMTPHFVPITRAARETHDVVTLHLENPDPASIFTPGQFNMLYLFGAGEVAISLSGDPEKRDTLTHTIRAIGSITHPLDAMKRGAMIGVRGPYGRGWPIDEARRAETVLLIGGGIGLAPLRPVIYSLVRNRGAARRVIVLCGARTPDDLLFAREFANWSGPDGFEVHSIVDRGELSWKGRVGVITDLIASARFDPSGALAMICGPEVMMRIVAGDLASRGLDGARIYMSMERNMRCAVGACGHCQYGPTFVCRDGPVFPMPQIAPMLGIREL